MPSSALVTQLFSSLMRVYRSFPPVAPFSGEASVCFDEAALEERVGKFLESRFCYVMHAVGEFQRERQAHT
jgi:hypothetical protein